MKQAALETLKIYQGNKLPSSLVELWEDLKLISKIKKCSFCGCNIDTLKELSRIALAQGEMEMAEQAQELAKEIESQKKYECLGCNPCYPADISNLLFEMGDKETDNDNSDSCTDESCSCNPPEPVAKWPVEKGNYFVGNESATVAINTLSNTELPEQLINLLEDKIAIVGYCETENIGVEKIVKNIISNPNIRTLIICGNEAGPELMGGHYAGQALIALHAKGIDQKNRVIGATGKRPVVKNLTKEQVQRFQSQVEIIDLVGNTSVQDISLSVEIALSKQRPSLDLETIHDIPKRQIIAADPEKLRLDKKGYFVIIPDKPEDKILVEYYANNGELLETVIGDNATSIYYTIIEKEFISRLDHCAYLGRELTRAEYFIKYDIPYTQDKAAGVLAGE